MKKQQNHFNPNPEVKKASKRFIKALKSGKIEKEVLVNTSEAFNAEKVSESIDNLAKHKEFLAIANQ